MQICFSSLGEVKINDNINSLDVNSSSKKICNQNNFLGEMIFKGFYSNNVLPPIGNNCRQFCTSLVQSLY
jgi:hypothetical protein